MTSTSHVPGLSWQRDPPDFRDYSVDHPNVADMLGRLERPGGKSNGLPAEVDLRDLFPETVPRDSLPISTAHACVGLVEYFDRRTQGKITPRSPLFLFQMSRKLAAPSGQTGTNLRATLKAMSRFGLPPECYWPSEPGRFSVEPDTSLCWLGDRFRATRYVRLDGRNSSGTKTLDTVRAFLAAGFPCAFGFSAPESLSDEDDIPFNPVFESVREGHAAVAVGYDDRRLTITRGALLVRCSVGVTWNQSGYRWLPYRYVEEQLAVDFWTVLQSDWLDSGELCRPSLETPDGAKKVESSEA